MAGRNSNTIYSATYSNVPVYEFGIDGNHVMRRRSDDWINATHILKVADYDKPARTRILEREVQKGVHEKVQGGYGKYQGTWIPLPDGRELAAKNGVLDKLLPIFNFVPGDRTPPPAPKHATAASSKPRASKAAGHAPPPPRRPAANVYAPVADYDQMDVSMHGGETPDHDTVASESQFGDFDLSHYTNTSRKRRRVEEPVISQAEKDHRLWAEDLLDYFMLQDEPLDSPPAAPIPPTNAQLDRPISDRGYTALHWAAAMGDLEVVKDLIRRGANVDAQAENGDTALMRAASFTNCFDKRIMEKLAALLIRTVNMQDWAGSTVFHVVANITASKKKYECARYYMDCILNKMAEILSPDQIERILNEVDNNGDTAITIAARHGARKCVRSLIGRHARVDIPNQHGETADQFIVQLNHRRQERLRLQADSAGLDGQLRQLSSSPFQSDGNALAALNGGAVQPPNGLPFDSLHSSINGTSRSALNGSTLGRKAAGAADVYKSEAALTLTSHIIPTLAEKARSLATSLDAQIAEKDAECAEAERVLELRRREGETLRKQSEDLRAKEHEQAAHAGASFKTDDANDDLIFPKQEEDRETSTLEHLVRECEHLVEQEMHDDLQELMSAEQQHQQNNGIEGAADDDSMALLTPLEQAALIKDRLQTARHLLELQRQRRVLVAEIVANLAVADAAMGNLDAMDEGAMMAQGSTTRSQYKRLITGALGVKQEDVEGMLEDIVEELEEARGL